MCKERGGPTLTTDLECLEASARQQFGLHCIISTVSRSSLFSKWQWKTYTVLPENKITKWVSGFCFLDPQSLHFVVWEDHLWVDLTTLTLGRQAYHRGTGSSSQFLLLCGVKPLSGSGRLLMGTFSFGDEYPLVPGPQKKLGSLLQLLASDSQPACYGEGICSPMPCQQSIWTCASQQACEHHHQNKWVYCHTYG